VALYDLGHQLLWLALLSQAGFVLCRLAARRKGTLLGASSRALAVWHAALGALWLLDTLVRGRLTIEPLILLFAGLALLVDGLKARQRDVTSFGLGLLAAWLPVQAGGMLVDWSRVSLATAFLAAVCAGALSLTLLILAARRGAGETRDGAAVAPHPRPLSHPLPPAGRGAPPPSQDLDFPLSRAVGGGWERGSGGEGLNGAAFQTLPEIALGRRLAARLGAATGSEVRVRLGGEETVFRVVGLLTSGGDEEEQAFAPLAAVQSLAGLAGRFTRAEVFALTNPEAQNLRDPKRMTPKEYDAWYCTAYPSSVAFQLGEAVPGSTARVMRGITAATADVLDRLQGVLLALAAVALVGAAVGVTAAMTATVLERRLEAGLLVAIGAPRGHVVLFFLSEAALLGVLGGLLGGAAGLAGGRLLGNGALGVAVPWMPQLLPFAALLGLAVAVVASLAPVVRALELYPAEILKKATA